MVRNSQEKDDCESNRLFQLYSPFGELYCFAMIFGYKHIGQKFKSVRICTTFSVVRLATI